MVAIGNLAVNLTAVAELIAQINKPTLLVCAGKTGRLSLEDTIGAGAIIGRLWEYSDDVELINDGATIAQVLWDRYKSDPVAAM